jgi:hypothetical protein
MLPLIRERGPTSQGPSSNLRLPGMRLLAFLACREKENQLQRCKPWPMLLCKLTRVRRQTLHFFAVSSTCTIAYPFISLGIMVAFTEYCQIHVRVVRT